MDRGAWWATFHRQYESMTTVHRLDSVSAKNQTQLTDTAGIMYPFIGKAWCCPFFLCLGSSGLSGEGNEGFRETLLDCRTKLYPPVNFTSMKLIFDFHFVRLLCLISQFTTERADSGKSDYHSLQLQKSPCHTLSDSAHSITCLCPDVCIFSYVRLYWASSFWFSSVSLPVMPSSNLCCEPTYYSGLIAINF